MDRRIETKFWTGKRLAILAILVALAASAAAALVYLSTPRLRVERDKLTVATVRRGTFQEYLLPYGEVRAGAEGPELRAQVNRFEAPSLAAGQRAEAEIAGRKHTLEITALRPAGPHDVEVDLRFTGKPPAVSAGQKLYVHLDVGAPREALLLDRGAFFMTTGGQWVWVVDEDGGTAAKRTIRLGRQNPEVYEVLSGLSAGEKVITSTYDHLEGAEELVLVP